MENERPPSEGVLTLMQVGEILKCSKAHVSNALNGKVERLPRLPHFSMGRRKLVRQRWLDEWLEAYRTPW